MAKPISLFSGYSQPENRTTNYCLLVLKMLYEESPRLLAQVLSALLGENIGGQVGVSFTQQVKKTDSIPDGLIVQKPITIFVETKHFDWFYDAQLESHLKSLDSSSSGLMVLLALGNFDATPNETRFADIAALCRKQYEGRIAFVAATFEDFLNALRIPSLPKTLADVVSDLRAYLDESSLLSSWVDWLDVVNCTGTSEDVLQSNVYMCPTKGAAYSHDRCAFFGMYKDKRVARVAEILAVVDVESSSLAAILWKNAPGECAVLRSRAIEVALARRADDLPARVFLLGNLFETDFRKDSRGGMMGSKQYFNVARFRATTAQELASALSGKTWSEFRSDDVQR